MTGWVKKKFQLTNFAVPTNMNSMRYALKSVPEAFSSGHRIIIDMGLFIDMGGFLLISAAQSRRRPC